MILRGIDFGNVLGASGVEGFFGEGYWYHTPAKMVGLSLKGMTFVAKTATLFSRKGNAPLRGDYSLKEIIPSCVKINFFNASIINAFGLSNPGLGALMGTGQYNTRKKPFFLSIMAVEDTPRKRLEEIRLMAELIQMYREKFSAPFGLQINFSCPNTGHDPKVLIKEAATAIEMANRILNVPISAKFSIASAPIPALLELGQLPACDSLCISNTVPYNWEGYGKKAFGRNKSPLAKMGGGGLSGSLLKPLVCNFIKELREKGFTKPINGGGGILHAKDVDDFLDAGASSIFIGSVVSLRPWRVRNIIKRANSLKWNK